MADDVPLLQPRGGRRIGNVLALAVIIVGAVVVTFESWPGDYKLGGPLPTSAPSPTSQKSASVQSLGYVGHRVCAECHPGESSLQQRSGHNRTLQLAEHSSIIAWLNGKSVADPKHPEVTWSYHSRNGRFATDRTTAGHTESLPLDYAVGSGRHGVTFVSVKVGKTEFDTTGIEHRLSSLANATRLVVTPGQESNRQDPHDSSVGDGTAFGRHMGPDHLATCLRCHATFLSTVPPDRTFGSTLIPNVSCERCHGPGREHVDAARRGETELTMRMGHEQDPPSLEVNMCGDCHRVPRLIPASSIRPENASIVRFQGVGLSTSVCYTKSRGELRCTTCHDPHDRTSSDHLHYESACLKCHALGEQRKACPVSPAANCIGCHMPRREIPGNGMFTDHWIRKPSSSNDQSPKNQPEKPASPH
jgi:hypothetical protein